MRFRKSFKLAPGVRMNVSGGGVSWTVGPRGASVNIGKRGTHLNMGIPGTGISTRTQLTGASRPRPKALKQSVSPPESTTVSVKISVSDDGSVSFTDLVGNPVSEQLIRKAKRDKGDAIKTLIQECCEKINSEVEALGEIHLYTPAPNDAPNYIPMAFNEEAPPTPPLKRIRFFHSLFKKVKAKIEAENLKVLNAYQGDLHNWQRHKQAFEAREQERKLRIEQGIYSNTTSMIDHLEESLQEITWPRETNVSAEILQRGETIFVDVDFPEIEEMPSKKASVPAKGYKLTVKELSATSIQKLYMNHIFGITFRVIGETFSALPVAKEVIFSGYSQRANKATGVIGDEYLISVRVQRERWAGIDFGNLSSIDVMEAVSRHDPRVSVTKTGILKPIQPFDIQS